MNKLIAYIFATFLFLTPSAIAQEIDLIKGAKVFKKCKSCHLVGDKVRNLVGPSLNGIVGGKVAAVEGYKYSKAMLKYAKENEFWSETLLAQYLATPSKTIKGTRMAFIGLRKSSERANVIAYLKQFEAQ